jgi:hypothetical protein
MCSLSISNRRTSSVTVTRKTSACIRLAYSGPEPKKHHFWKNDACDYIRDLACELERLACRAGQADLAARLKLVIEAIKIEKMSYSWDR